MDWILKVVKDFSFTGRARRKEYWMFTLFVFIAGVTLGLFDVMLDTYWDTVEIGLLSGIFLLATLVQTIAVTVRRLHDIGRTGWWVLIALVPFVGGIVLLIFMVLEGQNDTNEYGPAPKQA